MAAALTRLTMNNQPIKKKLVLQRDTLRTLHADDLDGVHGGKQAVSVSAFCTAISARIDGGAAGRAERRPAKDRPGHDDTVYRHDRQTI
jgi:hypothetical protein